MVQVLNISPKHTLKIFGKLPNTASQYILSPSSFLFYSDQESWEKTNVEPTNYNLKTSAEYIIGPTIKKIRKKNLYFYNP